MNHTQRIKNLLDRKTIDRPAVALWRHFPVDDQRADWLAAATLDFQRRFDFALAAVSHTVFVKRRISANWPVLGRKAEALQRQL